MGTIIVKSAVKRKTGYIYYIDQRGNICEAKLIKKRGKRYTCDWKESSADNSERFGSHNEARDLYLKAIREKSKVGDYKGVARIYKKLEKYGVYAGPRLKDKVQTAYLNYLQLAEEKLLKGNFLGAISIYKELGMKDKVRATYLKLAKKKYQEGEYLWAAWYYEDVGMKAKSKWCYKKLAEECVKEGRGISAIDWYKASGTKTEKQMIIEDIERIRKGEATLLPLGFLKSKPFFKANYKKMIMLDLSK